MSAKAGLSISAPCKTLIDVVAAVTRCRKQDVVTFGVDAYVASLPPEQRKAIQAAVATTSK